MSEAYYQQIKIETDDGEPITYMVYDLSIIVNRGNKRRVYGGADYELLRHLIKRIADAEG